MEAPRGRHAGGQRRHTAGCARSLARRRCTSPMHGWHPRPQLERGYATKDEGTMQFSPTPLGEALIR